MKQCIFCGKEAYTLFDVTQTRTEEVRDDDMNVYETDITYTWESIACSVCVEKYDEG